MQKLQSAASSNKKVENPKRASQSWWEEYLYVIPDNEILGRSHQSKTGQSIPRAASPILMWRMSVCNSGCTLDCCERNSGKLEELQELIMVFQNWWKDPWPRPLTAPFFFCSCSEFNTTISILLLFSCHNFQESDKNAIQARIDSVWGEDYVLVPSSFCYPAEASIAEQIEDCHSVAELGSERGDGARRREEQGTVGFSSGSQCRSSWQLAPCLQGKF